LPMVQRTKVIKTWTTLKSAIESDSKECDDTDSGRSNYRKYEDFLISSPELFTTGACVQIYRLVLARAETKPAG
jgi:hypothetical protein